MGTNAIVLTLKFYSQCRVCTLKTRTGRRIVLLPALFLITKHNIIDSCVCVSLYLAAVFIEYPNLIQVIF